MKRRNPVFLIAALMPLFVISFMLWAFHVDIAYAAIWVVSTTVDENDGSCLDGDCSLRDAIQVAAGGDTISIPSGTYLLSSQITTAKVLTLSGAGPSNTFIDGGGATRLFQINAGGNITFEGLTLRNGNVTGNGGGVLVNGGTAVITNTVVTTNTASANGGGIYVAGVGTLTLLSGQIANNTSVRGGGVYINQSTTSFTQQGGYIENNIASGNDAGAGVYVANGTFILNDGQIRNNIATVAPGATSFPGGGLYVGSGTFGSTAIASLNGGEIYGNTAYRGGGVMVNSGSVTLDGAQILSNTATYGGGIYIHWSEADVTMITGTIAYNVANPAILDYGGGGVYNFQGSLTVTGGQIENNTSTYNGGGIHVAEGTVIFNGGSLLNNTANNSGGGLYVRNASADITIDNAMLTGNSPNAFGIGDGSVLARGNTISNHTTVFRQTGGTFTAYANNIDTYTTGVNNTAGTFNGRHNWWGAVSPTGVNHTDSVNYRLGASVQSWGVGTLGDAAISGGTGTAVIVSHGRTNVPFAIPPTPAGTPCSDFYDFFTAPGASGTWTVDIPVDSSIACDFTFTNLKLFHFLLDGSNAPDPTCAQPTDCWLLYGAVSSIAGPPRLLRVSLTTAELGGTPIVVGDQSGEDPTAVTLTHFATGFTSGMAGVGLAAGILGLITAVFLLHRATTKFRFDRA